MTGAGAPGAAGILHCLGQEPALKVTVADASENSVGRYLANDFVKIPRGDDPAFVPVLLDLCRDRDIQILMPLVTKELIPLALHKESFAAAGTKILVSDAPSLEIANNKSRLYQFLEWRGIDVPAYRVVENTEQFRQALHELGYPGKPVCFKPSVSNGSRGVRILREDISESALLFQQKPGHLWMRAAEALRILEEAPFPELLVSEYLPGDEYSVDCLCYQGEARLIVPRLRRKMVNGITVEGVFEEKEEIINYSRRIIAELKLHGNIGIQVKHSAAGNYLLLEINPRVQGTISAALGAGVNLPLLAVRQEAGFPVEENDLRVKWGTRFSRYWQEVFY